MNLKVGTYSSSPEIFSLSIYVGGKCVTFVRDIQAFKERDHLILYSEPFVEYLVNIWEDFVNSRESIHFPDIAQGFIWPPVTITMRDDGEALVEYIPYSTLGQQTFPLRFLVTEKVEEVVDAEECKAFLVSALEEVTLRMKDMKPHCWETVKTLVGK
ncbi:MAG: hypothetical protein D6698_16665 [Gammaproteobacteria bacterium]|nr:MAG: hypothetical protein D6698_16665 [Gammaproteobacteria bacterium]